MVFLESLYVPLLVAHLFVTFVVVACMYAMRRHEFIKWGIFK